MSGAANESPSACVTPPWWSCVPSETTTATTASGSSPGPRRCAMSSDTAVRGLQPGRTERIAGVILVLARWSQLPKTPAVYALYGGWPPRMWVAYVGEGANVNGRIEQHFVRRDSSVTTGV